MRPLEESENQLLFVRYAVFLAEIELVADRDHEKLTQEEIDYIEKKCAEEPGLRDYIELLKINYLRINTDLRDSEVGDLTIVPLKNRKEKEKE